MTSRNVGFAGSALLVAGLFTPIVSMPIIGNVNLFNNGSNWNALVLALLAAYAAFLTAKDRQEQLIWPGASSAAILIFLFARLQYGLSEMRSNVATDLKDNPFAGLAQAAIGSIQLQWGWLVLAAGAGLLVYAGVKARQEAGLKLTSIDDGQGRIAAGLAALAALTVVGLELIGKESNPTMAPSANNGVPQVATETASASDTADGPTAAEAAYIRQNLRVYDLDAKYYDSLLEGRVPGVRFKLQNNGNRTLNEVKVRVVFYDGNGKAIAEKEYSPVLVSEYSVGGDNTPLRPNYIWQGDADEFYTADNVPSEWATGKATASITDIEFGPNE